MKKPKKGVLIVIDAPDAAGKKTQTKMTVNRLLDEGLPVQTIDFPQYGKNQLGTLIRECLDGKRGDFMHVDPRVASTLYAVDRFESKAQIERWLSAGDIVVMDRYVSSNMLHQGAKLTTLAERAELVQWLDDLEFGIFGLPRPDVVIYLDVPFDVRTKLAAARGEPDLAEADVEHQLNSDACARQLSEAIPGWERVVCTNDDGTLRSPIHINNDLFNIVRKSLGRY